MSNIPESSFTLTRVSQLTGMTSHMEIPMSEKAFNAAVQKWQMGLPVQQAFHNLNADQREFIMTGITPEEWDKFHGSED